MLESNDTLYWITPRNGFAPFLKILKDKILAWGLLSFLITLNYAAPKNAPLVNFLAENFHSLPVLKTAIQTGLVMTLFSFISSDPFFTLSQPNLILKSIRFVGRSMLMIVLELSSTLLGIISGILLGILPYIRTTADISYIFLLISVFSSFLYISFLSWWMTEGLLTDENRAPFLAKFYALPRQRTLVYCILLLGFLFWSLHNNY